MTGDSEGFGKRQEYVQQEQSYEFINDLLFLFLEADPFQFCFQVLKARAF